VTLSGKLVQVARPTPENSLALGAVGVAWALVGGLWIDDGGADTVAMYFLEPESPGDQEKVTGLLFIEGELEPLP